MLCDICGKKEAVIHIQQVKGNEESSLHLCGSCAALRGITSGENSTDFSISNLLTGLVDIQSISDEINIKKSCPRCQMTLEMIKKNAKLGCDKCFSVFKTEVKNIIERMYGRVQYRGKYPKKFVAYRKYVKDIEQLKLKLDEAIRLENYEEAAMLRDKIKTLGKASGSMNV